MTGGQQDSPVLCYHSSCEELSTPGIDMRGWLLVVTLALAYLPFAAMLLLYLAGWLLKRAGKPGLLEMLTRRTEVPSTVRREIIDRDQDTGASAYS